MSLGPKIWQKGILILVALGIWAVVALRFFGVHQEEPDQTERASAELSDVIKEELNVELDLSYQDPFLKGQKKNRKVRRDTSPRQNRVAQQRPASRTQRSRESMAKEEVIISWPNIAYKGMGSNRSREQKLAWIEFDGRMEILELDTVINGFKVDFIDKDSLVVSKNEASKTYYRQK